MAPILKGIAVNAIDRLLWEQELIEYLAHHTDEPEPPLQQPAPERATTLPTYSSAFLLWTVVIFGIASIGWYLI